MKHTVDRKGFRRYINKQAEHRVWITSAASVCPLAEYLESQGAHHPIVTVEHYVDENGRHKTPLWASRFVREIDRVGMYYSHIVDRPKILQALAVVEERMKAK